MKENYEKKKNTRTAHLQAEISTWDLLDEKQEC
jgi:hypothetical protein